MNKRSLFYLFLIEFLFIGIFFNTFGSLIPVIADHYEISLITVGFNLSLHAVALLITSIIIGRINHMINSRKILLTGILLEILGLIGVYFSSYFFLFILFYFISGIGMASVIMSISSLTCNILPAQKSRNLTILNVAMGTGVFIGPLLVSGFLRIGFEWLYLFLILGLLRIPVLAILYLISRSKIPEPKKVTVPVNETFNFFRAMFKSGFIVICIIMVFFHQGLTASFMFWFTTYFEQLGIQVARSSIYLSLYHFSIVIGLIIKVFLLKNINERKIMLVGYILGFISLVGFYFIDILQLKILFTVLFGLSVPGFFMLLLSLAVGHFDGNTDSVSSTMFTFGYLGIVLYQFLAGYISETFSPDLLFKIITVSSLILVAVIILLNIGFREKRA